MKLISIVGGFATILKVVLQTQNEAPALRSSVPTNFGEKFPLVTGKTQMCAQLLVSSNTDYLQLTLLPEILWKSGVSTSLLVPVVN